MNPPFILGINASHNGACCLLQGDRIVTAIQEERITRRKRHRISGADAAQSISYCLDSAGIGPSDLAMVVVCVQKGASDINNDLHLNPLLRLSYNKTECRVISHHLGHAISTFVTSGFSDAAILVADGVGSYWEDLNEDERVASRIGGRGGQEIVSFFDANGHGIRALEKHFAPRDQWLSSDAWSYGRCPSMPTFRSLGGMYSAVATQIFGDMDEAGKVMGLAPYGKPVHSVESFFTIGSDGGFVFSDCIPALYQTIDRWPNRQVNYQNLAASVQAALETALLVLARRIRSQSQSNHLCLAGGLALNSVANERIVAAEIFPNVHIIPAADDAGAAIGAAYYGYWCLNRQLAKCKLISDGLGRSYTETEIDTAIRATPSIILDKPETIADRTAELLSLGKVVAWFQGGSEFGPRALGNRSILLDPRCQDGKSLLNSKVKHRETFRPFAPSILSDYVDDWFDFGHSARDSRFMLRIARWRNHAKDVVPAVVHVDGTGRLQTVTDADGPFFALLQSFHRRTNIPILLNTSFNIMGEPIVETPSDALWALLFTGIDYCVIGNAIVERCPDRFSLTGLYLQLSNSVAGLTILPTRSQIAPDEIAARARLVGRWGVVEHPMTLRELLAVQLIGHDITIGSLTRILVRDFRDLSISEDDVLLTVASLRRAHIIEVHGAPVTDHVIFGWRNVRKHAD